MAEITPLTNQDNAYRSQVAGLQMAAEQAKEEDTARARLEQTKRLNEDKVQQVQDVKKVDELKEKTPEEKRREKAEDERSKSLNGGSLFDAVAE